MYESDRQRIKISFAGNTFGIFHLFRAHVQKRSHGGTRKRICSIIVVFGNAKIQQLHITLIVDENVGRLDITVDDTHFMRVIQSLHHLIPPFHQFIIRKMVTKFHHAFQIVTFKVFHDNTWTAVYRVVIIHLADIGMLQSHHHPSFIFKTSNNDIITAELWRKYLHCRLFSNLVFGIPYFCHTAFA